MLKDISTLITSLRVKVGAFGSEDASNYRGIGGHTETGAGRLQHLTIARAQALHSHGSVPGWYRHNWKADRASTGRDRKTLLCKCKEADDRLIPDALSTHAKLGRFQVGLCRQTQGSALLHQEPAGRSLPLTSLSLPCCRAVFGGSKAPWLEFGLNQPAWGIHGRCLKHACRAKPGAGGGPRCF